MGAGVKHPAGPEKGRTIRPVLRAKQPAFARFGKGGNGALDAAQGDAACFCHHAELGSASMAQRFDIAP
jgi:hypothetical protein